MSWDRLFPIACLIILIFIVIWIVRYKRVEGFSATSVRFNAYVFGETSGGNAGDKRMSLASAISASAIGDIVTMNDLSNTVFACNTAAGEREVTCPDQSKEKCCYSPNIYIGLRKANGNGPIDLSANILLPPKPPDIKSAAWIADAETRAAYATYQEIQDNGDTADDTPQDPPPQEPIPDFGVSLGQFASPVSVIPWDADNADSKQSDIMWGYVSPEASKSIWLKVYTNNLLSNPANLNGNDDGKFTYHSPLFDIDINDQRAAVASQIGEFLIMNAVFPKIQEKISIENVYNTIHKQFHKPGVPIQKVEKPVGKQLKSKVGGGKWKAIKKMFSNKYTKWFQKKVASFTAKFVIKALALKASLTATAAAIKAAAPAAAPYSESMSSMISSVIDKISTLLMIIGVIMGPILEQLMEGEGMCPTDYRALDKIIPQPAQIIISTFVPIVGDILDMFYPYICFTKPNNSTILGVAAFVTGNFLAAASLFNIAIAEDIFLNNARFIVAKSPLTTEPYTEDSTLSVSYANLIEPSLDGNGVGILPPPLENFKIQKMNGEKVPRAWCNFANPIMMDRMANFYYKYSYANQVVNGDDTNSYDYISGFIGVIASSELSCDVVCMTVTVTFNPVTGGSVKIEKKSPVYRRFYFIKAETDPQGYFTVTGCTNTDDCAPEAVALSTDDNANYVPSVPKVFEVTNATKKFDMNRAVAGEIAGLAGLGLEMGGGIVGSAVAAGASKQIDDLSKHLAGKIIPTKKGDQIGSYISLAGCAPGTECPAPMQGPGIPPAKYVLRSTDEYYYINRGPVIEQAPGYVPEIKFCQGIDGLGVPVIMDQCTDSKNLRTVIELYERKNPTRRIKVVRAIEPRGIFGCYYLFDSVSYNPDTNEEGIEYIPTEIIGYFSILNQTTCVRTLEDMESYATADDIFKVPRTINVPVDIQVPGEPKVKYPTRRPVKSKTGGPDTYVLINPREPFVVPSKLPKSTVLGAPGTCPTATCDKRMQIDRLIVDFNKAHSDRKIQKVLKAWTSKPDRCDYQVEMLRMNGATRVIQKETVSINVALDTTGVPCTFTRTSDGSDRINSGTFIQLNTPALSTPDTAGGILGYKSVVTAIQNIFNNTIKPILMTKPEVNLPLIASDANRNIENLSQLIFNEQTLKACPSKSCRDVDVLAAIAARYNADNLPSEEFYADKHVMGKILKSGVANESACDVIFSDMHYQYDDVLQPPTSQVNTGMVYRFKLTPTGTACDKEGAYKVLPGDYFDVSDNAIGVRSATTTLFTTKDGTYNLDADIGFTVPLPPAIDCRGAAALAALKAGLPTATTVGKNTMIPTYVSVQWSFSRSNTMCEYKIKKNVTTTVAGSSKPPKTKMGVETFVKADFSSSPPIIDEYDLENIEIDDNGYTTMNGKPVTLPFLANYDEKTRTTLIDVTEKVF